MRVAQLIPQKYLHETALVSSRLGRHNTALEIYVHQINDLTLAEDYCNRIYAMLKNDSHPMRTAAAGGTVVGVGGTNNGFLQSTSSFSSTTTTQSFRTTLRSQFRDAGDVYIIFFKVSFECAT